MFWPGYESPKLWPKNASVSVSRILEYALVTRRDELKGMKGYVHQLDLLMMSEIDTGIYL
jgi:hypothetical protein